MKKRLDISHILTLSLTNSLIFAGIFLLIDKGILNGITAFLLFLLLSCISVSLIHVFQNRSINRFINEILRVLSQFNEGNFTVRFHIKSKRTDFIQVQKQFEALRIMFNNWVYELLNSSVSVENSADKINSASDRSTDGMGQLNFSLNKIKDFLEESSGMLNDVSGTTVSLTESSLKIAKSSSVAVESIKITNKNAIEGSTAMESVTSSMDQMKKSISASNDVIMKLAQTSKQINSITDTIASISQQTTLLALNAAIESARAGEHGKGFAVVAKEIGTLSQESKAATDKISSLIHTILQEISRAVISMKEVSENADQSMTLTETTGKNLQNMMNTLTSSVSLIEQISVDVKEQSLATDTISQNIAKAAKNGHVSTASVQEISSVLETQFEDVKFNHDSTRELLQVSQNLDGIMNKYDRMIGEQMLVVCHQIAKLYEKNPLTCEELLELQVKCGLSEIHLFDENGVIFLSSNTAILGFKCSQEEDSQTYDFFEILHNPSLEVNQKTAFRDVDGKLFKYTGISMAHKKGIVQCGLEASKIIDFNGIL